MQNELDIMYLGVPREQVEPPTFRKLNHPICCRTCNKCEVEHGLMFGRMMCTKHAFVIEPDKVQIGWPSRIDYHVCDDHSSLVLVEECKRMMREYMDNHVIGEQVTWSSGTAETNEVLAAIVRPMQDAPEIQEWTSDCAANAEEEV